MKVNYRTWDLLESALWGIAGTISEKLTQKANLCLGKDKWYATHFQTLEKENGDLVIQMKAVKANVKNHV